MKKKFLTIREAHIKAKKKTPIKKWNWMNCGSEREFTLNENENAFLEYKIKSNILNNVSKLDLSKKFLNVKLRFPLIISPLGYMTQYKKNGELDFAKAAKSSNTFFTLSAVSSVKINEIEKKVGCSNLIYQFYSLKPRHWVYEELKKINRFNVKAICITGDSPVRSIKYSTIEDRYDARKHSKIGKPIAPLHRMSSMSWEDIKWLRDRTQKKIILKGITNNEDYKKCIKYGIDYAWVSNHGGRVLDSGVSSLSSLKSIKKNKKIPIIFDGGIRTGTDIFKALCLGADLVSIGRPSIWGFILNGADGISNIVNLFYEEFQSTVALSGCKDINKFSKKNLIIN